MNLICNFTTKIKFFLTRGMTWNKLKRKFIGKSIIHFYAGDIPDMSEYSDKNLIGLSLSRKDYRTINHDITQRYPIKDNTIDSFQAEDVFEHIDYQKLHEALNEIYRILKPGGYCRISVPDYRSQRLKARCVYKNHKIVFDPGGGGFFSAAEKVEGGGHIWFPTIESVKSLIDNSPFKQYEFYHYYDESGNQICKNIDYSKGFVQRTPDHLEDNNVTSIVVDLYK